MRGDAARTQALLERAIGEYEIDTVIHLAAQTIVGDRQSQPGRDLRGQHPRHVDAARGLPPHAALVKRSSSPPVDKAYGDREHLPYDEETPLQGRHPYDV